MNIKKLLRTKGADVETVLPATPVLDAVRVLSGRNIGLLVVCDADRRVAGVFSERDLARALAVHGAQVLAKPVADIMTRDVSVCRISDDMEDVMDAMAKGRFRHMPVVHAGKLAGIVSSTDILNYLSEHASSEERLLFLSKIVWI